MENNTYNLIYDLKKRLVTDAKFKQGDKDGSAFIMNLKDNGKVIDITGEVIEFRFFKPDKTKVFQDASTKVTIIDGPKGIVECVLMSDTLSYPGTIKCEIHRVEDGKKLTTPYFTFVVEASIGAGEISKNYISSIENKLIDWQAEFDVIKDEYDLSLHENTDIEIVNARKGEVNLGTKIGKLDEQLAHNVTEINNRKKIPTFTFILDDLYKGDAVALPIFQEFGWTFSSAFAPELWYKISTDEVEKNKDIRFYKDNHKKGSSILSHSMSHRDMRPLLIPDCVLDYEIVTSKKVLNDWGFSISGFVPPYSTLGSGYKQYIKDNYKYGFNSYLGNITTEINASKKVYHTDKDDYFSLSRLVTSDAVNTIEELKLAVDLAVQNNGFICFYDHNIDNYGGGTDATGDKLRALLTYIKTYVDAKQATFLACDEAVSYFFNIPLETRSTYGTVTKNSCPDFILTSGTSSFTAWVIPTTGEFAVENNENTATLTATDTVVGTEYAFTIKEDVTKYNLNDMQQAIFSFGVDAWINTGLEDSALVSIEHRFEGNSSLTKKTNFPLTKKRRQCQIQLNSPNIASLNSTYILFIVRVKVLKSTPSLIVKLTKPVFGLGSEIIKNQLI